MAAIRLWKLDEHLSATMDAFKALNDMIHHSRESLKTERKKAERKALKTAQTMRIISAEPMSKRDKEFQRILMAYTPLMNKYCGHLPRLINYGCLIQLYTLFEDRGTALCNELRKRDKAIPLKLGELGKPNFQTIKTYLTKLCGIQYKYWNQIELLSQLRHRIVHNNGHTEDKELLAQIKKTKGLRILEPRISKPSSSSDSLDETFDPDYVPVETVKEKPLIIVQNAYIDSIVPVVSGLFETVFQQKKFGDPSPFYQRITDAPLIVQGTGKKLKVKVIYQD